MECEILLTDRTYLKDVPPSSGVAGKMANVTVSVDILEILDIHEVQNTIKLQIDLRLTWTDRRLTFVNLKADRDLNTLIPLYRNRIWIPELVFHNTEDKAETLNDERAFATISRQGEFRQSPRSELRNAYIFKGSENPLTISRVYGTEFICEFHMANFPFDTQRCDVVVIMKGNTGKFVDMVEGALRYMGPIDLTQYFIRRVAIKEDSVGREGEKAVRVSIVFGRRVLATILTTYLPTLLLCIVCFSTNHFDAFFFEAIVTVNLTSLLVLTTLFLSIFNSLPTTAYVKMIDVWLIFNLFIPFLEVLLHTLIDGLRADGRERYVNHHGSAFMISNSGQVSSLAVGVPQ